MTQPHQIDRERDYPAEFEAWWADYRHRNREPADYTVKKQIAFDAFYFGACDRPAPMEAVAWREKVAIADEWLSLVEGLPLEAASSILRWAPICQTEIDAMRAILQALAQISTHPEPGT